MLQEVGITPQIIDEVWCYVCPTLKLINHHLRDTLKVPAFPPKGK